MKPRSNAVFPLPRRWFGRGVVSALAAVAYGLTLGGCSLSLDTSGAQCVRNQDCARFAGAVCDVDQRLCVPVKALSPATTGAGAGGGSGPAEAPSQNGNGDGSGVSVGASAGSSRGCRVAAGCTPCTPPAPLELLNGCSDVTCVAFDNRQRLANLGPDGGLTPLP